MPGLPYERTPNVEDYKAADQTYLADKGGSEGPGPDGLPEQSANDYTRAIGKHCEGDWNQAVHAVAEFEIPTLELKSVVPMEVPFKDTRETEKEYMCPCQELDNVAVCKTRQVPDRGDGHEC